MVKSASQIRFLGGILIVAGLFLSGSSGWLIWWLRDVIAHPGVSGRWTGGPDVTVATFRLFSSVLAFGVTSLAVGLVQLGTGRRSRLALAPFFLACSWLGYSLWALLSLDKTF